MAVSFQKADLAIADLTITYEREQAVDFTMPFMNLGKANIFRISQTNSSSSSKAIKSLRFFSNYTSSSRIWQKALHQTKGSYTVMPFNVTLKNKYGLFNICALAQYKEHGT